MQHLKGKRILAAPFKTTGELQKNPVSPDAKGLISTEGDVVAPAQTLLSPCTQTPCLYYEVEIKRLWEKTETTQDGEKTTKGSENVKTLKDGAVFGLDDGSGPMLVDASKGGDFDTLKKTEKYEVAVLPRLDFGAFSMPLPSLPSGDWTRGFEAVEKIVPVEGKLFALGKLEAGRISKPGWRSMMFSSKGRDGLLASTAKKKKFSLIGSGVSAVIAIPLMIFAPASEPSTAMGSAESSFCQMSITGARSSCQANLSGEGDTFTWTVENKGHYALQVTPPGGKKYPLDAQLVVKNAMGDVVADELAESSGKTVVAELDLEPGVYTVEVKDAVGRNFKGGFDYAFEIRAGSGEQKIDEAAAEAVLADDADDAASKKNVIAPLKAPAKAPVAKKVAAAPKGKSAPKAAPVKAQPVKKAGKGVE